MILIESEEQANNALNSKKAILVFSGYNCAACKQLEKRFAGEKSFKGFYIYEAFVEEFGELAGRLAIQSLPTIFIIKDGEIQENIVGAVSNKLLQERLNREE